MRRPKLKQPDGSPTTTRDQKRDIKQTDKTILDNFYKLVNTEGHVRLTAALSTFKILTAMKKTNLEKFNEHLNYCVERLVTGLASPRALARRGYATLLLEILDHHQFSTDRLFDIAQKKFGSIPKESKDNLVGYYLLMTIILESGNWNKWKTNKGTEYSKRIYECLDQLRNRKSYFEFPVNKLLVKYHHVFQPYMKVDILDHLADPPLSALGKHAHTHLTKSLFRDCSPETLEAYLENLINTFSKAHTPETRKIYAFCGKQMELLIRRLPSDLDPNSEVINRHESALKIGKFLIVNSLLGRIDRSKVPKSFWDQHGVIPAVDSLHSSTKKALKSAYHSTLDHIVSTCLAKIRIELMQELISFADALIREYQAVSFSEHHGVIAKEWKYYMKCLGDHNKLTTKRKNPGLLFPITSLYLMYGFQILEHNLKCKEQLEDLAQCAVEALKDDPNDGSWADILADQIIAILSATECNPWIRRLSVSVFGSLLPHITEESISLICGVFDEEGDEAEEDSEGEEESEDDPDAMEGVEEESRGSDEDDEEEDDDDDDGEDGASDVSDEEDRLPDSTEHNGKQEAKLLNGSRTPGEQDEIDDDTKNDEEEEEEEEEYLDDDQMMKLDSVLADMFKMNRVGKKKKDPSFQLRCLDLVKKIIEKKRSDVELIKKVVDTLARFANRCRRHKETRVLAEKVYKIIPKKKPTNVVVGSGDGVDSSDDGGALEEQ